MPRGKKLKTDLMTVKSETSLLIIGFHEIFHQFANLVCCQNVFAIFNYRVLITCVLITH